MKNLNFFRIVVLFLSVFAVSCDDSDDNQAAYSGGKTAYMFLKTTSNLPVLQAGGSFVDVEVGVTTLSTSDRTFSIEIDTDATTALSTQYTLDATEVTIPAGSYTSTVRVYGDYDTLPVDGTVELGLKIVASEVFVQGKDANLVSLYRACDANLVTLSINFDTYPDESGWSLVRDSDGAVLGSGDDYTGETSFSQEFCLDAGNYTFTFTDSWGDGMDGSYSLTHSDGTVLVTNSTGAFTSRTHTFTLN